MRGMLLAVVLGGSLGLAHTAGAAVGYFEGFEEPGWVGGGNTWQSSVTQTASGTDGITSSTGDYHGVLTAATYTRLGGYEEGPGTFGSGFVASLDIYIDPAAILEGQGFDYTVAISRQTAKLDPPYDYHLRDFMFHVGKLNGDLLVNASNNTDSIFNPAKLLQGGLQFELTTAGWYTFEQVFYDNGGVLNVDLNLYDDTATLLNSWTRTTTDDIATLVGGNRYGWFTYNTVAGLAIDNSSLNALDTQAAVPEPASAMLGLVGLAGLALAARRRRA